MQCMRKGHSPVTKLNITEPRCYNCNNTGIVKIRKSTGCDWEEDYDYCHCIIGEAIEVQHLMEEGMDGT